MAQNIPVTFVSGILPAPTCYTNEQARYIAYFTATTAYIAGTNLQWVVSSIEPLAPDIGKAWLKVDAGGFPKEILLWVATLGKWVRIFTVPHYPVSSGGIANALTLNFNPVFGAQEVGERFWFIAAATNTGACTLKVDGLLGYTIKKKVNVDLQANEILQGQVVECIWDGTNYQMVSVAGKSNISIADIAAGTDGQTARTRLVGGPSVLTPIWETSIYGTADAQQTALPAPGNVQTFAHGLVTTPLGAGGFIQCEIPENGYAKGARVPWTSLQFKVGADEIYSVIMSWDVTNVILIRPSDSGPLELASQSGGGSGGTFTSANWKCGAWAMK